MEVQFNFSILQLWTGHLHPRNPKLVDCRKNFSFYFDLIEKELKGPNNTAPIHRICTLMRKMGVESLIREELTLTNELIEERDAYAIRSGSGITTTAQAVRFTFFRKMPASGDWRDLGDEHLMGYAIIFTLAGKGNIHSYVYEAVVRPPSLFIEGKWRTVSNYYVHCSKVFKTTVGTTSSQKQFTFPGTFFCQQNGLTHVCAHAALRIALNNWPTYIGKKITSKIINDALVCRSHRRQTDSGRRIKHPGHKGRGKDAGASSFLGRIYHQPRD